jgi:hypothetical protein
MSNLPKTTAALLEWWPGNIPFKGKLVSDDGTCMCAQGQTLHLLGGYSVDDLRKMDQLKADAENARIWGISFVHSVLMRRINDSRPGAPSIVITNPELVLGDQAQTVLAFWRHLDRMRGKEWAPAGGAAGAAARAAAWEAAWEAAGAAARAAACEAAWEVAREAARATNEIQGAAIMRAKGQAFYFLPLFGFADPEAVLAADVAA